MVDPQSADRIATHAATHAETFARWRQRVDDALELALAHRTLPGSRLQASMRHAALLAKVSALDAAALPAHTVLRMATLGGAQALGLGEQIGSISAGKCADLCAIDLGCVLTQPCFDPASHLVYVAGREHVTHVWVNGESRVDKGVPLLQISDKELLRIASVWQTRFAN